MRLINRLLSRHDRIGWDVDNNILDHPNAPLMHRYVLENPHKTHFLVTFRSHGMQNSIFDDMAFLHKRFPPREVFDGILNVPDQTYVDYSVAHKTTTIGPDDPRITAYLEWKGMICFQYGITILVDDMTDHVIKGCDRYGVQHVHPDEFGDFI